MLLVPVAVAVIVAAVVLLGGGAALGLGGGGRRHPRLSSVAAPAMGLLGGVAVLGLLAVAGLAMFGAARGGPGDRADSATAPSRPERSTTTVFPDSAPPRPPVDNAPAGPMLDEPTGGPEVRLSAQSDSEFADVAQLADGLADNSVLRVTATGFLPDSTGGVAHCTRDRMDPEACRDRFPVRFDDTGTARFQYLVSSAGDCGPGSGCHLVLRDDDGRSAILPLVFGARMPPPGTAVVAPRRGLEDGRRVEVSVAGLPPGSLVHVVQCVPPGLPVAERCGAPGPVPLVVGAGGRASGPFAVASGPVGAGGHPCRRGSPCGVAVVSDGGLVLAPVVPISFSAGAGASYDPARLALGLGTAALLLALATWLVRKTDWREPTEASTPAMDAAQLSET